MRHEEFTETAMALLEQVDRLTRQLSEAYRKGLQKGFEIAESEAWVSQNDDMGRCNPHIVWGAARKALEKAKAEVKP